MPRIKFVMSSGAEHEVEAQEGTSVMQAAMDHLVPGMLAECGGYTNCATCHAYVDEAFVAKIPEPSEEERVMLDCAFHVRPNSRLACQVQVTPALEGLVVHLPVSQTEG
ncbi:2Fe-2S iron-sulfur cluster-binding protein [Chondromyces crocatus]|uniref:(2Fe-2S) ferredoxin n=1 Tax=Chondromyces crocatus TaxID=52 RepID=A0A0K1EAV2_CHOCO|nr:2Fe-2S iron-sulfur cluster-binding protein [Chondromyces crocatus]AKT37807.1 (2Fe-2S) ferredoxin [Chondromyces crocatus]